MTSQQEKWTAPVVRKTFLEYFEGKGHTVGTWRGSFFWGAENMEGAFNCLNEFDGSLGILFLYSFRFF
jgi:hypothetical protein